MSLTIIFGFIYVVFMAFFYKQRGQTPNLNAITIGPFTLLDANPLKAILKPDEPVIPPIIHNSNPCKK